MNDQRYVTLRWIARNLPWVWRHLITARTRIAWVREAAEVQSRTTDPGVDRLDRIMSAHRPAASTEDTSWPTPTTPGTAPTVDSPTPPTTEP